MRLAQADEEEIVSEAIADGTTAEMGGTLGRDGKINYRADAGDEAREQLLCEALVSNLGALADESRLVAKHMIEQWRDAGAKADEDQSGTIDEDEAAEIWQRVLGACTKFVAKKLEALGVASKNGRGGEDRQRTSGQDAPGLGDGTHSSAGAHGGGACASTCADGARGTSGDARSRPPTNGCQLEWREKYRPSLMF